MMQRQDQATTGSRLTAEELAQGFMKMAKQAGQREARGEGYPARDDSKSVQTPTPDPHPPADRGEDFQAGQLALDLCDILGERENLQYYRYVARMAGQGRLLGGSPLSAKATILKAKARELTYLKKPNGPINHPPAVFAAWVKSQMDR